MRERNTPLYRLAHWILPSTRAAAFAKLAIYIGTPAAMGFAAYRGTLPRTRPIIPGELMVAD
jgi:hypothetical protein